MRTGVISDIHGNLPALEAVLADMAGAVDEVVCLGDVVNYGPWGDECVDLLGTVANLTLLEGNHEALFLGKESLAAEIPLVQQFFAATQPRFTRWDQIANWRQEVRQRGWLFTHTLGHRRIYQDTEIVVSENVFLGHTHHAFDVPRGPYRVVNPGSVGQNRKRLSQACYAVLASDGATVELKTVEYDCRPVLDEMRRLAYPRACVDYYAAKAQ